MASAAPFLPPHLVRSLALNGPRRLPHADRFPAALLFSDISGFTALTERLQSQGRAGAEGIARLISRAFAPVIAAIERHAGSITYFGGDALFSIFDGPAPVRRAHAAAEEIRRAFEAMPPLATSAGFVRLGMKQALHHGPVVGLHLGTEGVRHYLQTGRAVAALARLEARAVDGAVLVSDAARAEQERERRRRARPRPRAAAWRRVPTKARAYLCPELLPMYGRFRGEYRRATVLFLETRGSSARLLQAAFLALCEALASCGGVLLESDLSPWGNKWLCLFGVPHALEDHAERAARAALILREKAPSRLRLRAGISSGVIAILEVGSRSRRNFSVWGDVVNTAARTLSRSAWGEILVTEATRAVLAGVVTEPRGAHAVKGKSEPLELHAVVSATAAGRQLQVSSPLVGRDAERAILLEALRQAVRGTGGAVGLRGEAGVGKSRLKWELAKEARAAGVDVHEGRARAFGGSDYWVVAEMLGQAMAVPPHADPGQVIDRVDAEAARLGLSDVDRHHLAEVLGTRAPDSPVRHLDPQTLRANNAMAVSSFARARARLRPGLWVLEDMHWSDAGSREIATRLARDMAGARAMLLLLYRPGWTAPEGCRELALVELSEEAVARMLDALLGALPRSVTDLITQRASGNPFYVEEVARHLIETGALVREGSVLTLRRAPGPEDLPGSIEGLIEARLDMLSPEARCFVQVGAVVGRSFPLDVVAGVREAGRDAQASVRELMAREILFERAREPGVELIFKHALTRDVAYETILRARRKRLHHAVALSLADRLGADRERYLPMLGHHWERAGRAALARPCYLEAARLAAHRYALEDAEGMYRSCLALCARPTAERVRARNELGEDVLSRAGRGGEALREHSQALQEARAIGDREAEAASLRAIGVIHRLGARLDQAQSCLSESLGLARELRDPEILGRILGNLATLARDRGNLAEAQRLFEEALAVVRSAGLRRQEGVALQNLATLHNELRHLEVARALYGEAITLLRQMGDRPSEGKALTNLANTLRAMGETAEALALQEQALGILREVGDRRGEGAVLGNMAQMLARQGRRGEARELLDRALAIFRDSGDHRFEELAREWLQKLT